MTFLITVIAVGWIAFWLYWLISALNAKKGSHFGLRRFAAFRIVVFVLAVALIKFTNLNVKATFTTSLSHGNLLLAILGLALFVAGLALAVWARVYLGINWGMPMSVKDDPELVITGPYSFIRHPIYTGILLALLGSALTVSLFWLVAFVVAGAYFVYSAYQEEKLMIHQFPKVYPLYQHKTKMLIPYIW